MGVGVSLLGMLADHSVKNYKGSDWTKDKLVPSDDTKVQRVAADTVLFPRDTRVFARTAVESHEG